MMSAAEGNEQNGAIANNEDKKDKACKKKKKSKKNDTNPVADESNPDAVKEEKDIDENKPTKDTKEKTKTKKRDKESTSDKQQKDTNEETKKDKTKDITPEEKQGNDKSEEKQEKVKEKKKKDKSDAKDKSDDPKQSDPKPSGSDEKQIEKPLSKKKHKHKDKNAESKADEESETKEPVKKSNSKSKEVVSEAAPKKSIETPLEEKPDATNQNKSQDKTNKGPKNKSKDTQENANDTKSKTQKKDKEKKENKNKENVELNINSTDKPKKSEKLKTQDTPVAEEVPTQEKKDKTCKKKGGKVIAEAKESVISNAVPEDDIPTLTDVQYEQMLEMAAVFSHIKKTAKNHNLIISDANQTLSTVEDRLMGLEKIETTTQLVWKISDFKRRFVEARKGMNKVLYSPEFHSHRYGYKIALSLVPNGDGKGSGTHMSLFFSILRGDFDELLPWPFSCGLRFTLMDQSQAKKKSKNHIVGTFTPNPSSANMSFLGQPTKFRNPSLGLPNFASLVEMWNNEDKYVCDDTIFIKVDADLTGLETRLD